MPQLSRILPPIAGTLLGTSIGFYVMSVPLVTDPGYQSVLKIQPPFLSSVFTGDVDEPGKHYHLRFTSGIPVKTIQAFTEHGAAIITNDYRAMAASVQVTLRVTDPVALLRGFGEDWYKQEVSLAVAAAAGLAGMSFGEEDLNRKGGGEAKMFEGEAASQLRKILLEKNIPVTVDEYRLIDVHSSRATEG